ncbi:DUF421 domain-containing protein [Hymenobacter taeanensis]|uniref:DUF421 domain-containing protein n=1 Tax=Hymenobacter taeanensis TaxID=2735321 RepID=A0A6M6BG29_9BACT|nr:MULTISPECIES: YetF domain-containing protein [Hymenobacter]QJX46193.1 DUF421 domain-containing protein [Hymenobacter taeanensis]UOQ80049.1 DUF421 domain-containing protein [Hymenobacter sp. 5414T-23]
MHFLNELLGLHASSHNITTLQMCARAIVVFLWALTLLRLAGHQAFGSGSTLDMVLKVIFGAVLSRAIVAASPFWATLMAGGVLVGLYRLLSYISYYSDAVGRLVKGDALPLIKHGQPLPLNLRKISFSEKDLHEGLRNSGNLDDITQVEQAYLERNGRISVVPKKKQA